MDLASSWCIARTSTPYGIHHTQKSFPVWVSKNLDKKLIKPTNLSEMNWVAKRPKDSSLDVSQAISILQEKPFIIEQGLDNFVRELRSEIN